MGKKERLLSPGSSPECYGMGRGGTQEEDILNLPQSVPQVFWDGSWHHPQTIFLPLSRPHRLGSPPRPLTLNSDSFHRHRPAAENGRQLQSALILSWLEGGFDRVAQHFHEFLIYRVPFLLDRESKGDSPRRGDNSLGAGAAPFLPAFSLAPLLDCQGSTCIFLLILSPLLRLPSPSLCMLSAGHATSPRFPFLPAALESVAAWSCLRWEWDKSVYGSPPLPGENCNPGI